MEFEDIIRKRTSVRKFSNIKLEQEKLDKILEAGRVAPTAKNNQPIKIYIVNSKEGIDKIDKACNDKECHVELNNHIQHLIKGIIQRQKWILV